jgi:hypothetical protein
MKTSMRGFLRWLLLAAFSAGLYVSLAQRWRTVLGTIGFLLSFLGVLSNLCGAPPGHSVVAPVDIHETAVAETFPRLTPREAAALVGVLYEYRLDPGPAGRVGAEALELEAAVSLVARVSGWPRGQIRRLYREHWIELRSSTAPKLLELLSDHRLVDRLLPFDDE